MLPLCRDWAGRHFRGLFTAGAFAKGTANRSGSAIDFVVLLDADTPYSLYDVQESLHEALWSAGLSAMRRDVSLTALVDGVSVDLIPARQLPHRADSVELYTRSSAQPIVTDLAQHVEHVLASGRMAEIRALKLWRDQNDLKLPSFYLELSVLAALRGEPAGTLADNVWHVLGYLEKHFITRALVDPANAANIVSDELSAAERQDVADAAAQSRSGRPWSAILV